MNKELLDKINNLVSDINDLKSRLNRSIDQKESELNRLIEKVSEMEYEKEKRFKSFDEDVKFVEDEAQKRLGDVDQLEARVNDFEAKLNERFDKIDSLSEKTDAINAKLNNATDIIQKCSQDAQKISDFLVVQEHHENRLKSFEEGCKKIDDFLEKKNFDVFTRDLQVFRETAIALQSIQSEQRKYSDNLSEISKSVESLKNSMRDIRVEIATLKAENEKKKSLQQEQLLSMYNRPKNN